MPNSLKNYYRQPQLHITLPSKGQWWPPGSIEFSANNELPVMPMTAKDELAMKQPDALMNGQATVDVIQSCVPGIKNAWQIPSVDVDTILLGIRIATYGDSMEVNTTVPGTKLENTVQANLNTMMDQIKNPTFVDTIKTKNGLTITIRPWNYKENTAVQMQAYEEQRMVRNITASDMTESSKIEEFQKIFLKLSHNTVTRLSQGIVSIQTSEETVTDRKEIEEFIANIDTTTANEIKAGLDAIQTAGNVQPIDIATTEEMQKDGAPKQYKASVTLDNSNFFVSRYSRSTALK